MAQTWTATSLPSAMYLKVGSSPDGKALLVGTYYGPMFVSTNAGLTWAEGRPPIPPGIPWQYGDSDGGDWQGLASSADGNTWIAAPFNGPICVSTNQGASWAETSFTDLFHGAACSADGRRLVAVADHYWFPPMPPSSGIYLSSDGGSTWTQANAPALPWFSVACSADGTKIAAAGGSIYLSADSGTSWRMATSALGFSSVAGSANGARLIAASRRVSTSTDSGSTWADAGLPDAELFSVTCSADGTKMMAAALRGPIYLSTNSGTTWTATDAPVTNWYAITSSADGMQVLAATQDINHTGLGLVYIWQAVPAPQLSLAASDSDLTLSWTVPSRRFVLQQNADLSAPNWTDVATIPTLNTTNLQNQATLPKGPGNMFYRLVSR